MTPAAGVAVALGAMLGLGLWTMVTLIPRLGAPRLADRVARGLVDVSASAREHAARRPPEPASVILAIAGPVLGRARSVVSRLLGGDELVERRLRQAGLRETVDAFRSRQLLWGAAGVGAGCVLGGTLLTGTTASPTLAGGVVMLSAAAGLLAPDQLLQRAARARQRRIADEFPTVVEFLALALGAGEGVLDALRRVAQRGTGELARELGRAVDEVQSGVPLATALHRAAHAIDLPAFTRLVDQLVGALDRGSPLVEVFRAQAQDSREEGKRVLLESAGRKEVAMLVPLVFLILPVTIVFAVYPGLLVLRLGF